MRKLLLATAAFLALTTAGNAAVIGTFGTDPTSAAGFFSNDPLGANIGGVFFDQYTFDLDAGTWITVTNATNTFARGGPTGSFAIQNFTGAIYEIVGTIDALPGGDDILRFGPQAATLNPGGLSQSLNGIGFLPSGEYYLAIAGNAGTQAGYGGNLSVGAVPEPATWAMMIIGFVGVSLYGGMKARRGDKSFRLA